MSPKTKPSILIIVILFVISLLSLLMGCESYHRTVSSFQGFRFDGGITFDPDDFIDNAHPGINLRAFVYDLPDVSHYVKPGGTWPIKWSHRHQEFEVVPAPPSGLQVLSVAWGLSPEADTPHIIRMGSRHGRSGYFFSVPNNRRGDVILSVRAEYGYPNVRNRGGDSAKTQIESFTLHFAVDRWDAAASAG